MVPTHWSGLFFLQLIPSISKQLPKYNHRIIVFNLNKPIIMTFKIQTSKNMILGVFILGLGIFSACSEEGDNSQLNASAGNDLNVLVGQLVTLNGNGSSDSDGNSFSFSWKFISKPPSSTAQLGNINSETPTFTPDVQGKYKIELEISNTSKNSDTITVSAFKVINVQGSYTNLVPGPNVGIRDFESNLGKLYATCEFTKIGGIDANKIAYYDGSNWHALGCGLEEGSIYDMIGYKGEVYVAGNFDEIGCIPARNIARWNGNSWKDVLGGLTGGENPYGHAMAIYKNELYVAGQFTLAGSVSTVNIAKWDGVKWSAVGKIDNGSVRDLEVYKDKLYAGGFFTSVNGTITGNIAAYDGNSWSGLGSLTELELKATGVVRQMAVLKDVLYISGSFSVNDNDFSELITWNGTKFDDFGRAFSLYANNTISELSVINNVLYIGGNFRNVVGSQTNNILQWDGENWGILSQGTSGTVLTIESFNNKIYIGGDFKMAGGKNAENISIWTKN
jgi:hypothetical protein